MASSTFGFEKSSEDDLCINTIRVLAADITAKAKSGHPGAPMGCAPMAHVLFSRFMNINPKSWKNHINRDRFVLSNGHGCALQYIILHLLGFNMPMDDLKRFRQLDSLTPGHPEHGHTEGVEVTTGPLGQGFANSVGLAIAGKHSEAVFNKEGFPLFDGYIYCIAGDGCLMEGMSSEAASLAGHLQLGNLIVFYDDNHISIDGDTNCAFTEDVAKRFEAYAWHVQVIDDGDNDLEGIHDAIVRARQVTNKPSLIQIKTTIGFGSQLQGTGAVHGNPLKPDDVKHVKKLLGFKEDDSFVIPDKVKTIYQTIAKRGEEHEEKWNKLFAEYGKKFSKEHADLARRIKGDLPEGWQKALPTYKPEDDAVATRKSSEVALSKLAEVIPELMGGSADLTGSNLTRWKDATDFQPPMTGLGDYSGRYIRYGVREHAMNAAMNGLASYGTVIPYGGTFLNFTMYGAGALRISALSHHRVIYVATHDSIGQGEDGPTHQPIEVAAFMRSIPNLNFMRPADGNEVSASYLLALESKGTPTVLCLTRQNVPHVAGTSIEGAVKGGYVIHEEKGAKITLVATGSELAIAADTAKALKEQGIPARVVSLPSFAVFDKQPFDYRLSVLPDGIPALSIEVFHSFGWAKYTHESFSLDTFGASAPYKDVYKKFGFTPEQIAPRCKEIIDYHKSRHVESRIRRALYPTSENGPSIKSHAEASS